MDLFKSISVITLILSLMLVSFGLYLPYFIDEFLQSEIQQKLPLTNGSESTEIWSKPEVPIFIKFYLFHLKNPEELLQGLKPVFQEIGPYTFSQKRENVILAWNQDETMFDYESLRSYHFEPSLSAGSLDDSLTMINFPVVALSKIVADKVSILKKTVGAIIKRHGGDMFLNLTVGQMLFDGFEVPLIRKISSISRHLQLPLPDRFGLMYQRNGSGNGIFTAFTGKQDISKLLKLHRWNEERSVNCWSATRCGLLNGTDGTWFHPFLSRNERLYLFSAEMNRSIFLDYTEDSEIKGISTLHYAASPDLLRSPTEEEPNQCFCVNNDTTLSPNGFCSIDGVLDISNCHHGLPLVLSLPHFLYGNQLLIQSVGGINPDLGKHLSYLDVEPLTGIVMEARRRIQFNLRLRYSYDLGPITFKDMVYPLAWLEEGADLTEKQADKLKKDLFSKVYLAESISISSVVLGIGLVIFSMFLCSWPYISKKFIDKYKKRMEKERNAGYSFLGLQETSQQKPTTN